MSTVARSIKGTLVGGLSFAVQILQSVLIVPLLLQGWGASTYALWLTCQAGMGMLTTLELGHQLYVGNELAKSLPVNEEKTRHLLGSSLRFSAVQALVETAIVTILWLSGGAHLVLGVSAAEGQSNSLGAALFLLVASWLVVGSSGGVLARLYPPAGKFARGVAWSVGQRLALSAVTVVAATYHQSVLQTSLIYAVVTFVTGAAFTLDVYRNMPELRPFLGTGNLREGMRIFANSLPLTGSVLVTQLQTSGLILLVSSLFGDATIASFATVRTLSNSATQAAALVFAPAIPEFVRMHVRRDLDKVRFGLFGLATLTSGLAVIGTLLLAVVSEPLYDTWTRHKIPFDRSLFHLILASVMWRIAGYPLSNHLQAMNDTRWIASTSAIQTAVLFCAALLGAPFFGVHAVAIAMLLSELLGSVVVPSLWLYREFPSELRAPFVLDQLSLAAPPLAGTMILACSAIGSSSIRAPLLVVGALVTATFALLALRRIPADMRRSITATALKLRR